MRRYWLAMVLMLVAALSSTAVHAAQEVLGIPVVPYSKKIDDKRFRSSRDLHGTLKHFRKKLPGRWKFHREVNLPTVKYTYVENRSKTEPCQGINVYQLPSGEVRFFVVENVNAELDKKKS